MASYLQKDFTSSPTNADKFTISFWAKMGAIKTTQVPLSNTDTAGNGIWVELRSDGKLGFIEYVGGVVWNFETNRLFLDPTSWYHIVIAGDSTQATNANKLKIYINGGSAETFSSSTYASTNTDWQWNKEMSGTSNGWKIGESYSSSSNNEGYLAHIHNVDGTAYAPTVFGETDSTTGEWKPILSPSVTYGTNGWFLKFENSSALGTDSSGNGTTFTVNGDLKQSISTPSNNFCTLDPHQSYNDYVTYAGTATLGNSTNARGANSTQMVKDGKWYAEFKVETDRTTSNGTTISIYKNGTYASRVWINEGSTAIPGNETGSNGCEGVSYQPMTSTPNIIDAGGGGTVNYGTQASANDIIMMAVDLSTSTSKIWWGRNGTWFNAPGTSDVGNPASGTNAGLSFTKGDEFWGVNVTAVCNAAGDTNKTLWCNFGEGRFGTTAVSSGNADDAGKGVFEYDVPTGFYAICTKNIKTYG